ncbi:MAG: DNA cytosine methyltransferase [Elusimicrobia bacterium]|nr:DNA cytosine methyltransferase [Elusimicrobiota bacterium]
MVEKKFIDLFAGCGGLSLGLINAGWKGIFAIEKSPDAFQTLKHNLIDQKVVNSFNWPVWLPCEAMTTSFLLEHYIDQLKNLQGTIELIAGGPPCQGFSIAGKRKPDDPRNSLTEEYIRVVDLVKPKFLLLENVKGFKAAFKIKGSKEQKVYSKIVKSKLEEIGYIVYDQMLNAADFGVPQIRERFIMIAVQKDIYRENENPFIFLNKNLEEYLINKNLYRNKYTTTKQAISDLETDCRELVDCEDFKNFKQIKYSPKNLTKYQKLMREHTNSEKNPNSLRLAKHRNNTKNRFNLILNKYEKGKNIPKTDLESFGTNKQCFTPLHPNLPCRTITTLPDDLLHYSEPRILTVRENARIQSFPDWFDFLGKYTTGGDRRKKECPRYTQVGNAVPPLMAEALGTVLLKLEVEYGR